MRGNKSHKDASPDEAAKEATNNQTNNNNSTVDHNFIGKLLRLGGELILFGGVATGLWVIGERLEAHGFKTAANVIDIVSALLFFAIVPLTVIKFWPERKKITWIGFALICPLVTVAICMEKKDKHEPKPHPSFEFFLATLDMPDEIIGLTNSFLAIKFDSRHGLPMGNVFLSKRPEKPDVGLQLWVKNNSAVFAESIEVLISITPSLNGVLHDGWKRLKYGSEFIRINDLGLMETNSFPEWSYGDFNLLPGDANNLPLITLPKVPTTIPFTFGIMVRAKDSPTTGVEFDLLVMPTNIVLRPIVNEGTNSGRDKIFFISPNEMRKSLTSKNPN